MSVFDQDSRTCTFCQADLAWDAERKVWAGPHDQWCPVFKSKQANEYVNALRPVGGVAPDLPEADLEYVAGPNGAPLWKITASTGRTVAGINVIDEFLVRAHSYDGALIMAREMRPYIQDAEAVKLDG